MSYIEDRKNVKNKTKKCDFPILLCMNERWKVCTDTHIDMEGKSVAQSFPCLGSYSQLGLSVGAVIKQRPC